MKSDFAADKIQLEEALTKKEPYAVLVVSTTGLDYGNNVNHSPTRVQLYQYEYNDETLQYEQSISFNQLVAANLALVNGAIATAQSGGYDAFAPACIDPVSYKAQIENPDLAKKGGIPADQLVLTEAEFKQKFEYVMNGLQRDNTAIIANERDRSVRYLDKIGCADQLKAMQEQGKLLDQSRISAEYLHQHGRDDLVVRNNTGFESIEKLRNFLTPVPNAAKQFDKPELAGDFKTMSKEDFLKAHKVSERAYDIKVKDAAFRETKATAPECVGIMSDLVTAIGREKGSLESERMVKARENEAKRFSMASERGKRKYQNASVAQKIKTQIEMGILDKDAVLNGDSDYHRLMEVLHGDKGNKGVLFAHIATSGFNNPNGNSTGLPMQIVVHAFDLKKDGTGLDMSTHKGSSTTMKLPPEVVLKAEESAKKDGFDVFADAGVDINEMKKGSKNIVSENVFLDAVDKIFRQFDPKEYPIVALNVNDEGKAFFQRALESICNFDVINAPCIDLTKVVSEYSLLTVEGEIPENRMFGDNAVRSSGKSFGIRDIEECVGIDPSKGTSGKVNAMMRTAILLYNQYLQLNPELTAEAEQKKTEPEKTPAETPAPVEKKFETERFQPEKPAAKSETLDDFKEVEEPEFAEEDGDYEDVYVEEPEEPEYEDLEYGEPNYEDYEPDEPEEPKETPKETPKPAATHSERSERPERPDRRKAPESTAQQERPERPKQPAPSTAPEQPANSNVDMTALLTAVIEQNKILMAQNTQQNAIIAQQAETIAKQNASLFEIIQQQNALIKDVLLDRTASAPAREHVQEAPKAVPMQPVEGGTMDKLEQIKDNIDSICDEVSGKVKNCLQEANASIAEGQAQLEKEESKTK